MIMGMAILTKRFYSLVLASLLAVAWSLPADAQSRAPTFIRDAEIEAIIGDYVAPLFSAAGLDPDAVHVYLIKDDTINAFVAGGQNVFLYTGLIMKTQRPSQLIGVVAHETGHITGGHLARRQEALRNATIEMMVACILGMGAAAASGNPAGAGACALGSSVGQRSLLQYSRTQESSADQAGLSFLDATGQSARGMLEFLSILQNQEALLLGQQDPYLRTHPLTQDRIDAVRDHVEHSRFSDVPDRPEFVEGFKRMQAKLLGYLNPTQVLRQYPESDTSLAARYARTIYYYLSGKLPQALASIDGLIAEHPSDPYFQELKGEMLFKNGRARDSLPYYGAAAKLQPRSALLRLELAQAQIEVDDPALNKAALTELEEVVRIEPRNPGAWRQLSIAYGRDGQLPMAALALAESALSRGGKEGRREAKQQADRAMQGLKEGSPSWLRAQDIYNEADRKDDG
jgi:predicted Zn-dependent protease